MTSAEYNHSAFCFYLIEKICHPFGIWNVDLAILESFHPFRIVALVKEASLTSTQSPISSLQSLISSL